VKKGEDMKNKSINDNDRALKGKAYVKPTVVKHTAASLVVGSSSAGCGYSVANSDNGGCISGVVSNTITYWH
jgi:hypothetical protein